MYIILVKSYRHVSDIMYVQPANSLYNMAYDITTDHTQIAIQNSLWFYYYH